MECYVCHKPLIPNQESEEEAQKYLTEAEKKQQLVRLCKDCGEKFFAWKSKQNEGNA